MNAKFRFYLLNYLATRRQRGFALPIVVMCGLVIAVVGATMVMQGMQDNNKVVSQKTKSVADAAAEAGLVRLQNMITQNPALAQYSMEEWRTAIAAYEANPNTNDATLAGIVKSVKSQSCTASAQTDAQVKSSLVTSFTSVGVTSANATTTQSLQSSNNSNPNFAPFYQLKNYYYYPNGTAKVKLVGLAGANGNGKSNVVATLPVSGGTVSNPTSSAFPGLWVKQYLRAGQNNNNPGTLDAHVAYDCGMNVGTFTTTAGNGSSSGYTEYVSSGSSGGGTAVRVALPTGQPAPEVSLIPMPDPPSSAPSGVTPASLGSITGSLTLPRSEDTTTSANYKASNQTYYYTASSIAGNGVNLQFTPGQKVVILLTGNISIGGSSQITHNCGSTPGCDATDVQILGATANTSGLFSTGGNSAVCSIFFWAPTYTVDMNGGGNAGDCPSGANQNGIYWVKAWQGGGQGSHQALNQSGSNWNKVKSVVTLAAKPKLGSPTQWLTVDDTHNVTAPTADELAQIAALRASTATGTTQNNQSQTCTVPPLTNIALVNSSSLNTVNASITNAGLTLGTATAATTGDDGVQTQTLTAGASVTCGSSMGYTYKLPANPVPNAPVLTATAVVLPTITWQDVTGATGYTLSRCETSGSNTSCTPSTSVQSGTGTTYTQTVALTNNANRWCFSAIATNNAGSSSVSNIVCGIPNIISAPTAPVLTATSAALPTISWGAVAGATSYQLYRCQANNNATCDPNVTTNTASPTTQDTLAYDSSGLTFTQSTSPGSNKSWCYKARATNTAGSSALSNRVCGAEG
ncbi:MAG: hypothetical protein ACK5CA_14845 [Cyanobacteriota bacterium]|jgi:Tfp pilus assembly protein PilX